MTDAITVPDGLTLTAQEWRVFTEMQDWADAASLTRAVNGSTSYIVIVSKIRRKLAPFDLIVSTRPIGEIPHSGRKRSYEYRIERAQAQEMAA